MDRVKRVTPRRKALSAEQKAAFVILLFLGIGGAALGFRSFGASVSRPFEVQLANLDVKAEYLTYDQQQEKYERELKERDTDGDGLSDYDEINVFLTSPYLADSDSDGADDRAEAFAGEDPNCPAGRDCGSSTFSEEAVGSGSGTELPGFLAIGDFEDLQKAELDDPSDVEAYFRSLTIAQIRKSLLDAGLPQSTLDEISDEELRALFNKVLSESSVLEPAAAAIGMPLETEPVPVEEPVPAASP